MCVFHGMGRARQVLIRFRSVGVSRSEGPAHNYAVATQLHRRLDQAQLVRLYAAPALGERRCYSGQNMRRLLREPQNLAQTPCIHWFYGVY
jgi:hypothetical protein